MLKTAPPETIEQAHAEAFAQLTPEQRRLVLQKTEQSGAKAGSLLSSIAARARVLCR